MTGPLTMKMFLARSLAHGTLGIDQDGLVVATELAAPLASTEVGYWPIV